MADRSSWRRQLTRYFVRPLETLVLHILYLVFRVLPIDAASALGGGAARAIGPRLRLSNRARKNIRRVFPRLDDAAVEGLVREMWDNLGRLAGELPHLPRIKVFDTDPIAGKPRTEVVGIEKLNSIIGTGKAVIFFSAHIANWEIGPLMSMRHGLPLNVVYRSANNRVADKLFLAGRRDVVGRMIPKGPDGARQAIKLLQDKQPLAMLLDQKMNDGIAVPFFGHDAMTAPAIAQFALRYDCLLVPTWTERLGGAYFRTHVEDPLVVVRTGVRQADIMAIMMSVNARIEDWIRQRPGQWLWLHRRWPD